MKSLAEIHSEPGSSSSASMGSQRQQHHVVRTSRRVIAARNAMRRSARERRRTSPRSAACAGRARRPGRGNDGAERRRPPCTAGWCRGWTRNRPSRRPARSCPGTSCRTGPCPGCRRAWRFSQASSTVHAMGQHDHHEDGEEGGGEEREVPRGCARAARGERAAARGGGPVPGRVRGPAAGVPALRCRRGLWAPETFVMCRRRAATAGTS